MSSPHVHILYNEPIVNDIKIPFFSFEVSQMIEQGNASNDHLKC